MVRFTGGEPTLHPDIADLCDMARFLGSLVILNTNGLTRFSTYERLLDSVNTIKLSVPTLDPTQCDRLTGVKGSLRKKLDFACAALERGVQVEFLTTMVPENLGHLEEFMRLANDHPGTRWVPLRVESSPQDSRPLSRREVQRFAEEFEALSKTWPDVPRLRLGVPFCAVTPVELGARVFSGRGEDCGPFQSLAVTWDGELVACYSCRKPIRPTGSLARALEGKAVKELTDTSRLARRCQSCPYLDRCMGGCASPHAQVPFEGGVVDYLVVDHD